MPANPRRRNNNVQGTTTDVPLLIGATTMNSAGLANLEVISSEHAVLTLDPLRVAGAPEFVIVTAHTGSATSATITRAAYGSVAREHLSGTVWVHAPLTEDFVAVEPTVAAAVDPYEGMGLYETTNNKLAFYTGADWAYRDAGGQLGYAEVTASQTLTAAADLTSLAVTVTVATGRRVRITGYVRFDNENAAVNRAILNIQESTTVLSQATLGLDVTAAANQEGTCIVQWVGTPSAGAHTYKLRGDANLFNLVMASTATNPAFILVEDIGAA